MRVPPRSRASLEVRTFHAPLLRGVLLPAQDFLHKAGFSGVALLFSALVALVWANSPFSGSYQALWHLRLGFTFGEWGLTEDLRHWVNDVLMVLFFYVAGLEIRRAFSEGELREPRRAALPVAAAFGGMLVPALVYLLLNLHHPETRHGWGIPMATDIAFAVGVVALTRAVSRELQVFLLALAIVDDIGAVVVIALFYTPHLHLAALALALSLLAIMGGIQRLGVRHNLPYILGCVLFTGLVAASGIHSTIAGVVLGLLTPREALFRFPQFLDFLHRNRQSLDASFAEQNPETTEVLLAKVQQIASATESTADRLERGLHAWTNYIVLPLFALANAGILLRSAPLTAALHSPVMWGVALGLLLGKPIGILLACWATVRLGIGALPAGATWRRLAPIGVVAGIGFTMSLFLSDLAFTDEQAIESAKAGVFAASLLAGIVGYACIRPTGQSSSDSEMR